MNNKQRLLVLESNGTQQHKQFDKVDGFPVLTFVRLVICTSKVCHTSLILYMYDILNHMYNPTKAMSDGVCQIFDDAQITI